MAKNNPVGWFEIYVQDMARARKFYESVFNIKLEPLETPDMGGQEIELWAFPMDMQIYGAAGALVKMDGFESGNNSVLIYFSCEDCAVEEKRAAELGGRVERSKFSIGQYGFISLVKDTEGNMLGLHTPPGDRAFNCDDASD
jgi:uncharacterized protein